MVLLVKIMRFTIVFLMVVIPILKRMFVRKVPNIYNHGGVYSLSCWS